jgi:hypothetical protein
VGCDPGICWRRFHRGTDVPRSPGCRPLQPQARVKPEARDQSVRPTNNRRGQVVPVRELAGTGNARLWPGERPASAGWCNRAARERLANTPREPRCSTFFPRHNRRPAWGAMRGFAGGASTEGLTSHVRLAVARYNRRPRVGGDAGICWQRFHRGTDVPRSPGCRPLQPQAPRGVRRGDLLAALPPRD